MVAMDCAQAKAWLKIIADSGLLGFRRGRCVSMRCYHRDEERFDAVRRAIERDRNRALRRGIARRRREREAARPSQFTHTDWLKCKIAWGYTCAYCGLRAKRLTQDHFIPLIDPECPGTVPWNIIPACVTCNSSKSTSSPSAWYTRHRRGFIKGRLATIRAFLEAQRQPTPRARVSRRSFWSSLEQVLRFSRDMPSVCALTGR